MNDGWRKLSQESPKAKDRSRDRSQENEYPRRMEIFPIENREGNHSRLNVARFQRIEKWPILGADHDGVNLSADLEDKVRESILSTVSGGSCGNVDDPWLLHFWFGEKAR